ncbi:hypothetical protein KKH23_10125 [Patescibacteria group bacterium]|nr:hypothetical protein [Patescibacteria group bacterium]
MTDKCKLDTEICVGYRHSLQHLATPQEVMDENGHPAFVIPTNTLCGEEIQDDWLVSFGKDLLICNKCRAKMEATSG